MNLLLFLFILKNKLHKNIAIPKKNRIFFFIKKFYISEKTDHKRSSHVLWSEDFLTSD